MKFLLVTFFTFTLFGCASAQRVLDLPREQWEPGIYDVQKGEKISKDELLNILEKTQYILIGESHDSSQDHEIQKYIVDRIGRDSLVGFEMFQRPFQHALDKFSKDEISEEKMLEDVQWSTRWGFELDLYSPIWRSAKNQKARLIALNIRKELTKRIASQGIDGLTPLESNDLVDFDLNDLSYRNWLQNIFESHGGKMSEDKMQRFFEAQVLWDETMADTSVNSLTKNNAKRIIILAGRGHIEWDWGIPSRIRRRIDAKFRDPRVKSLIPSDGNLPSLEALKERRFADYVWVRKEN